MIRKEKFYDDNEKLRLSRKKKIWNNVNQYISNQPKSVIHMDWKSFAMGIAATILFLFTGYGIFSSVESLIYNQQPDYIKVNNIITSFTDDLETQVNQIHKPSGNIPISIDDYISSRKEKLENINYGIKDIRTELNTVSDSEMKHKKLRELYLMKLSVIEEIINIEEKSK